MSPARQVALALLMFVNIMSSTESNSLAQTQTANPEAAMLKRARAIHDKVIALDTHIDFAPADLTGGRNYTQRLETQFNLPNMIEV